MKNFLFLIFLFVFKSSDSQLKLVCEYNPKWSYSWFCNNVDLRINSNILYSIGKNVSGTYKVIVSTSCDTAYSEIEIKKPQDNNKYQLMISNLDECPDELHINEAVFSFIVFPNPTTTILNFRAYQGISSIYKITIYDQIGKKIIEKNLNSEDQIDVSLLSKGMYVFEVVSDNSKKCKRFNIN